MGRGAKYPQLLSASGWLVHPHGYRFRAVVLLACFFILEMLVPGFRARDASFGILPI
jgi:hypothetical protein